MRIELERTAYKKLLEWKKNAGRSTLEVSGARQVGKTYLVNKFADKEYKQKIYINLLELSGELFLNQYEKLWSEMTQGKRFENPVYELIRRYEPSFTDSPDTVVIIDEIQESAEIYNRVREFTRQLSSDFIITGSYLGRVLNKEFKYSAGDLDSIEIQTLSFEEFLRAMGKWELYDQLDIYGGSGETVYKKLEELYQIYCTIGGYPAVVLSYLEQKNIEQCQAVLEKIVHLFANESRRYFEDILEYDTYENIFTSVARILVKEKKGLDADSFSEELQSIVIKEYSSNLSKAEVNRAIDWLHSAGIIGFAGKLTGCDILSYKAKSRAFFMDLGLTTYFLTQTGCASGDIQGVVNENFVFLDLRRRISFPREIALETPAFATWGNYEIDFYVKSIKGQHTYAVEVKSGKNSSRTMDEVLEKKKADYILYTKGKTHGGVKDHIYTIPIYGLAKFRFE
jgi:predicted AAA+ superfamily ATPase